MKNKSKIWSKLLAVCMIVVLLPLQVSATAATGGGLNGHWANADIEKWNSYGIIELNDDYSPNEKITRGDFAAIINRLAGGVVAIENPNEVLTRQEAAVLIAKAFEITPIYGDTSFMDDAAIADTAKGYVKALETNGIISGRADGCFYPLQALTNAEAARIIPVVDMAIEEGIYTGYVSGDFLIGTSNVVLQDLTVNGNIYISSNVKPGDIDLDSVTIYGNLYALGNASENVSIRYINRSFTFDNGTEDIITENEQHEVQQASLLNTDKVLSIAFDGYTGGDYEHFKLVLPTTEDDVAAYQASSRVSYDLIFPKAAVLAADNKDASFRLVIATPQNGWWREHVETDAYHITDMTPYGDDYYKLTIDEDILSTTSSYTSGIFYILPVASAFTCESPIYVDNISFYTELKLVDSIAVAAQRLTISVGSTFSIEAVIAPSDATNKNVFWESSDTSKLTVDENGLVTAIESASTPVYITAISEDGGHRASCEVTVTPQVRSQGITLNVTDATLSAGWGETVHLTATVNPEDTSINTVSWSSSDTSIAKVRNGVVTAIKAGVATITATADDSNGSVKADCVVTVTETPEPTLLGDGTKKISVDGTKFVVGAEGKEIWINGVNTPWNNWDEFAGGNDFDPEWWDEHFKGLSENGVNASRVWFLCSGDYGIQFDADGYVVGMDEAFWKNAETLFEIAEKNGIYIMATMASFDCFSNINKEKDTWQQWRMMIQDDSKIDSYVENYLVPFANRFGSSDYLWSIDLCNEIDWVYEEEKCGQLDWEYISNFLARSVAGIRQASDVLVTIGLSGPKYNTDPAPNIGVNDMGAYEGNKIADNYLQSFIDDTDLKSYAVVDFYSTHYYGWQAPWFGNPFSIPRETYGLVNDRPFVIAETASIGSGWSHMYANDSTGWQSVASEGAIEYTLVDDYSNAYDLGYNGVMSWTSNSVDSLGGFDDVIKATSVMAEKYPDLIFPLGVSE